MTYNPKPSQALSWATSPSGGTSLIKPTDALLLAGYGGDDVPTSENFNWMFNLLGQHTGYLQTLDATVLPLAATYGDLWGDFVVSGGLPSTSASLTTSVPECIAYTVGQRNVTATQDVTVTASKDTYLDVDNTGALHLTAVANNAAAPSVYANSQRLAKLVSSGTAITSVTDLRVLTPAAKAGQSPLVVFAAISNLQAATNMADGALAEVNSYGIYRYSASATDTTVDNRWIVMPSGSPSSGRWFADAPGPELLNDLG